MPTLDLRPAGQCRYDLVSLGEVMLRFDPGEGQVCATRAFRVWEGGGEYNVARETGDLATAVEYGAAHGALAMTTPGDTSMANLREVSALVRGAGVRVQR